MELKPSKRLKRLLAALHGLAMIASIANALPIAAQLTLVAGICAHFCFAAKQLKNAQHAIKHTEAFGWEVSDGNDFEKIQILNSTVITVLAIFLHFNKNAKKQSLLIMNDALDVDDYRRLIVRVKTTGSG